MNSPLGVVCGALLVSLGASAQLATSVPEQSSLADRAAPSGYQFDDGTITHGWGDAAGKEIFGIHRFVAADGSDVITSISAAWGLTGAPNGSSARVFVWQDDGSGDIRKARLLATKVVTVQNAATSILNVYPLNSPVVVTGVFYVGFSRFIPGPGSQFPLPAGDGAAYVPGRTFVGATFGSFNPSNLAATNVAEITNFGQPGYFLLRANGSGSAFSYQGRLTSSGTNYSGAADFIFTIYDSASGGSVVGMPIAIAGVSVNSGTFHAQIPADPSWFVNQPDRYLDVQVRTPAGNGTYEALAPRGRIGQVPAAMVATVAQTAQSVPWSGVTDVPATVVNPWTQGADSISYTGGKVGVQVNDPAYALDVGARMRVRGANMSNSAGIWFSAAGSTVDRAFVGLRDDNTVGMYGIGAEWFFTGDVLSGNVGVGALPSGVHRLRVNGNVLANNVAVPSSIRFKDHVTTMDDALGSLLKLEGVRFDWKPEWAKERPGREHDIGFVAEDVAKIFPEVVFYDENGNVTGMDYSRLTAVAVQAIKELKAEQQKQIEALQAHNAALQDRLERLERAIGQNR